MSIRITQEEVKWIDNALAWKIHSEDGSITIEGELPENYQYHEWIAFCAGCFLSKPTWYNYAGNLGKPYYPMLFKMN